MAPADGKPRPVLRWAGQPAFNAILMAARYRGRWRLAALAPLVVMVPLAVHAGLAYAAGAPGWPLLLVLAAPVAFGWLLLVGIMKVGRIRR